MFNIGDKIKFNNETKEKFRTWLNSPDNCGRVKFCEELKRFDLDDCFTIIAIGDPIWPTDIFRITLKEMSDWYFDSSEFVKIGDCKNE